MASVKPPAAAARIDLSKHVPEEMQAPDFLSGARSQRETCDRLHAVFAALKTTPQTPAPKLPPAVGKLAEQLATKAILQAKDMEARTLAACCIVELLRIFAPSPPYAPSALKAAFDTLIAVLSTQLKLTGDDQAVAYDRALHVLRSLVTVRSACILPELASLPLEDGTPAFSDRQIIAFAAGLLDVAAATGAGDAASNPRTTTLHNYIVEALVAVVEELTDVTTNILATLVVRLLDKASAPAAYLVVANVIHRCEAKLVPALAQMVSASLETAAALELEDKTAAAAAAAAKSEAGPAAGGKGKASAGGGHAAASSSSGSDSEDGDNSEDGEGSDDDEDGDNERPRRRGGKDASAGGALGSLKALVSPTAALRTRTPRTPEEAAALRLLRRDAIYSLVLELVAIAPSILGPAVTVLVPDLEHDTPAVRSAAVSTLGRIFCIDKLISPADAGALAIAAATSGSGSVAPPSDPHAKAPIAVVHAAAFEAWCRRFRDKEPSVRKLVVRLGGELLRLHAPLSSSLASELASRHADPDDEVRLQAVMSTCDAACLALKNVPTSLLEATAGRLLDKRPDLRREAATGLAQTAAGHLPGVWARLAAHAAKTAPAPPSLPSELFKAPAEGGSGVVGAPLPALPPFTPTEPEAEVLAKLAWIPDRVLACYDHPDAEMRLRVVQLLDHVLLPESLSPAARAQGLLSLVATLQPRSKAALMRLLSDRAALQAGMRGLLAARAAWKKGETTGASGSSSSSGGGANAAAWGALARGAGGSGEGKSGSGGKGSSGSTAAAATAVAPSPALARLQAAAATLGSYSGGGAKAAVAFLALAMHVPDNRVFKYLTTLCDPTITPSVAKTTREELFSRLKLASASGGSVAVPASGSSGSVSVEMKTIAEASRTLVRRLTMTTFSILTIPHLIHALYVAACCGRPEDAAAGLELLQRAAEAFPDTFLTEAEAAAIAAPEVPASGVSAAPASAGNVAWDAVARPPSVWVYLLALLSLPPKGCPASLPLAILKLFTALGPRLTGAGSGDAGGCLSEKQVKRLREALLALACGRPPAPLAARLTPGIGLAGLAKATRAAMRCALAVFPPVLPGSAAAAAAAAEGGGAAAPPLPAPDAAPAALVLDALWTKLGAALFTGTSSSSGSPLELDAASGCNAAELVCRLAAVGALARGEPLLLERLAGGKASATAWQAALSPLLRLLRSDSVEDDMLDAVVVSSHTVAAGAGGGGGGGGSKGGSGRLAPIREESDASEDDDGDEGMGSGAARKQGGAGTKRPREGGDVEGEGAAKRLKGASGSAVPGPAGATTRIVITAVYKGIGLTSSGYVRVLAAEAARALLLGQCGAAITLRVSPRPEDTAALGRLVPAIHGACSGVFDVMGRVLSAGGDLCIPRTLAATTLAVAAGSTGGGGSATASVSAALPAAAPSSTSASASSTSGGGSSKAGGGAAKTAPSRRRAGGAASASSGKLGGIVSESEVDDSEAVSGVSDAESVASRRSGARGAASTKQPTADAAPALPPGALTDDDAAGVRLACARTLLALLSTPVCAPVDVRLAPVPLYLRLAATLLDAQAAVRAGVLTALRDGCAPSAAGKARRLPGLYLALTAAAASSSPSPSPGPALSSASTAHPALAALTADAASPLLPLRYCLLPALVAGCDPKPAARKAARTALLQACAAFRVQRLRLAARGARPGGGGLTPEAAHAMLLATPELAISCLLFVLTHDAARFPSEAAWRAFLKSHRGGAAGGGGAASASAASSASDSATAGPFAQQMAVLNAALDALVTSASHIPSQLRVGEGGEGSSAPTSLPLDAATTAAVLAAAEGGAESFSNTAAAAYGAVPGSTLSGSLSMLLSLFTRVRDTRDAVSVALTPSLHACADLAFLLAKARAKEAGAFKPYEGTLPLPVYMFAPAAATATSSSSGSGSAASASKP